MQKFAVLNACIVFEFILNLYYMKQIILLCSETCPNWTLDKPVTCVNQTSYEVSIFNLCKPNTVKPVKIFWTLNLFDFERSSIYPGSKCIKIDTKGLRTLPGLDRFFLLFRVWFKQFSLYLPEQNKYLGAILVWFRQVPLYVLLSSLLMSLLLSLLLWAGLQLSTIMILFASPILILKKSLLLFWIRFSK